MLKHVNKWKLLFFTILLINIIVITTITIQLTQPLKEDNVVLEQYENTNPVEFKVDTTKKDLNRMITHYIEKEGLNGPIDYKVVLADEVELYGTLPFFTRELDLKLTFEPKALQNGDLILKQHSISIGEFELPVSYVLKFVRDKYKLPEWVNIQPNDELVYVALQKMKLKSDVQIKANKFNLKEDEISFTLLVPTK